MNVQGLRDQLDRMSEDATIQCLVWDSRLECDVSYDISEVRASGSLVSLELVSS